MDFDKTHIFFHIAIEFSYKFPNNIRAFTPNQKLILCLHSISAKSFPLPPEPLNHLLRQRLDLRLKLRT